MKTYLPHEVIAVADALPDKEWIKMRQSQKFLDLFNIVFKGSYTFYYAITSIKSEGSGCRYVVGVILLGSKANTSDEKINFEIPENLLHAIIKRNIHNLIKELSIVNREDKINLLNL